jgi:hypothetical protein
MATRNWWIEAEIDGRKTKLTGGPRRKDGGFTLTIRQHNHGQSEQVLTVRGIVLEGGRLQLVTIGENGQNDDGMANLDKSFTHTTER